VILSSTQDATARRLLQGCSFSLMELLVTTVIASVLMFVASPAKCVRVREGQAYTFYLTRIP